MHGKFAIYLREGICFEIKIIRYTKGEVIWKILQQSYYRQEVEVV